MQYRRILKTENLLVLQEALVTSFFLKCKQKIISNERSMHMNSASKKMRFFTGAMTLLLFLTYSNLYAVVGPLTKKKDSLDVTYYPATCGFYIANNSNCKIECVGGSNEGRSFKVIEPHYNSPVLSGKDAGRNGGYASSGQNYNSANFEDYCIKWTQKDTEEDKYAYFKITFKDDDRPLFFKLQSKSDSGKKRNTHWETFLDAQKDYPWGYAIPGSALLYAGLVEIAIRNSTTKTFGFQPLARDPLLERNFIEAMKAEQEMGRTVQFSYIYNSDYSLEYFKKVQDPKNGEWSNITLKVVPREEAVKTTKKNITKLKGRAACRGLTYFGSALAMVGMEILICYLEQAKQTLGSTNTYHNFSLAGITQNDINAHPSLGMTLSEAKKLTPDDQDGGINNIGLTHPGEQPSMYINLSALSNVWQRVSKDPDSDIDGPQAEEKVKEDYFVGEVKSGKRPTENAGSAAMELSFSTPQGNMNLAEAHNEFTENLTDELNKQLVAQGINNKLTNMWVYNPALILKVGKAENMLGENITSKCILNNKDLYQSVINKAKKEGSLLKGKSSSNSKIMNLKSGDHLDFTLNFDNSMLKDGKDDYAYYGFTGLLYDVDHNWQYNPFKGKAASWGDEKEFTNTPVSIVYDGGSVINKSNPMIHGKLTVNKNCFPEKEPGVYDHMESFSGLLYVSDSGSELSYMPVYMNCDYTFNTDVINVKTGITDECPVDFYNLSRDSGAVTFSDIKVDIPADLKEDGVTASLSKSTVSPGEDITITFSGLKNLDIEDSGSVIIVSAKDNQENEIKKILTVMVK